MKKIKTYVRRWGKDPNHCGFVNFYLKPRAPITSCIAQMDHDTFLKIFGSALKPGYTYSLWINATVKPVGKWRGA